MSKETAIPTDLRLLPGESIHRIIKPDRKAFFGNFIGILTMIFLALGIIIFNPVKDYFFLYGIVIIFIILVIAGLVHSIVLLYGNMYIITDRRVIGRFDFIVHRESTIYFDRVQNVKVRQGILDNLLKTGAVFMETASGSMIPEESLLFISRPRKIRDELMQLIDNHRGNNDGLNPQTQIPSSIPIMSSVQDNQEQVLLEILEELKAIRKDLKS